MPLAMTMTILRAKAFDVCKLAQLADWLAVGVAVALPWSTTATGILIALWLVAVLPTLSVDLVRRELVTAAGGLPVLLWLLGAAGMLWADIPWSERLAAFGAFHRLLALPLLLAQFRRSGNGARVFDGFLVSTTCLLLASWAFALVPALSHFTKSRGVPVHDYILQSDEFLMCTFALLGATSDLWRAKKSRVALACVLMATFFLANIAFVVTSRTTLLVVPALVLLLGWKQFGWKGLLCAAIVGSVACFVLYAASPNLREKLERSASEFQTYRANDADNSTGEHIDFLLRSLRISATAPLIGHGTGSIAEQFRLTEIERSNVSSGQTASSVRSNNPHNQIFAVAVQLGAIGVALLIAMWAAHFMLFGGGGLNAWIGLIVVAQNVVSSLFNSHLFDFSQGWLYVFGVGVAGGVALREREGAHAARHASAP
jgi:O-antigen ligase